MKHLFLIHSHTVFLTAVGVIEKLGLQKSDIIIINFRHYKNPDIGYKYMSYDLSDAVEESFHIFFSYSRKHYWFDKKQKNKTISFFDDFIDEIVKDKYILYVPQLQSPTFQILATNKNCQDCCFIQEGARIMYDCITNQEKWYFNLYNKIVLRKETRIWKAYNWFPNKNNPYQKPITAYAFDKAYFGDMPNKTVLVTWPKVKVNVELNPDYPIFALEAAVELGQIEKNIYKSALKKLITECAQNNNYIKFHPQQNKETQEEILNLFYEKGFDIIPLPMDIPFELIVASHKGLTVCGFGSSLLFYAKAFGHKVISNENDLLISPRYRMYQKKLQKIS